jgi:hypothetical protein
VRRFSLPFFSFFPLVLTTYSGFSKSTIYVTHDDGFDTVITDGNNFLRGGWETNKNGIVTFNTIFPGYCELQ